jgi:hypothetical protein
MYMIKLTDTIQMSTFNKLNNSNNSINFLQAEL